MIWISVVFIGISCYELRFLIRHRRKPRTYWITGSCILAAYVYLMAIHMYPDLPSANRLIEYLFEVR